MTTKTEHLELYFAGAEKPTYRRALFTENVSSIAINVTHLRLRKGVTLGHIVEGRRVLLYASPDDEDIDRFERLIRENAECVTAVVAQKGMDRGDWFEGEWFPLWADPEDHERLAWLCERKGRVAIPDRCLEGVKAQQAVERCVARWGARALILSSKVNLLGQGNWAVAVVGSWTSADRYGEVQVWDGRALRRYPKRQQAEAWKRHRGDIVKLGIDHELLSEGDRTEALKLALRSWQSWSAAYHRGEAPAWGDEGTEEDSEIATIPGRAPSGRSGVPGGIDLATGGIEPVHERSRSLLPILRRHEEEVVAIEPGGTEGEAITVTSVRVRSESMRQCNSCYLAERCPGYEPASNCAYDIPVELRTKDDLTRFARSMLELQGARILFARFGEDLEGQGVDPVLSAELDRLFKMLGILHDISDERDTLKISVEAKAESGMLSRIFGAQASAAARRLPSGGLDAEGTDDAVRRVIDV